MIDSGFRNEWFIPMTNVNDVPVVIAKKHAAAQFEGKNVILYPYEKAICQAVLLPVPRTEVVEKSPEEIRAMKSLRGMGELGSSGK